MFCVYKIARSTFSSDLRKPCLKTGESLSILRNDVLFLRISLMQGFSAYSSPIMIISRKATQDKRVVTDFRHLNVRIAKNNLAYPLLKDTFSVLGSSRCKVLSVLDLKDAFYSLRLLENSK